MKSIAVTKAKAVAKLCCIKRDETYGSKKEKPNKFTVTKEWVTGVLQFIRNRRTAHSIEHNINKI